jgi:hypothetical protein
VHATICTKNLKLLNAISCKYGIHNQILSDEKILDILNDSCECVLSASSENGSSDVNGKAITAEEVHSTHTTWKEERYDCLPPTV